MSSFMKSGVFAVLAFCFAAPFSYPQTRSFPEIFQLSTTGAYLGIEMDDVTASNMAQYKLSSERGVIVRSVMRGSPAADAGLREDDVILEYAGFQVWSAAQLSRLVSDTPAGRKVDLAVIRDGKRITLTAQVGSRGGRRSDSRLEILPRDFFGLRPFPGSRPDVDERAGKPRLGVTLQPLTEQLADHMGVPGKSGVLIASVTEGSPGAGKLRAGDVVVEADGRSIREPEDLTRIIADKSAGPLTLKVIRDKKEIPVTVNLPPLEDDSNTEGGISL